MAGQAVKRQESGASSAGTSYYWQSAEVERLERLSAESAGVEQLLKELPGRSLDAIYKKAVELRFVLPGARRPAAAWKSDDATDELIRLAYADGTRGAVSELASRLGVDRWRISKRATELNLASARLKDSAWSRAELQILEDLCEQGPAAVHRELRREGFERSPAAVATMVSEHLRRRERTDAWSARSVAELMGVDPHTVLRWITHGSLKARQEGGQWLITRAALRQWVVEHPQAVDLRRIVDKFWFIDMLGSSGR